MFPYKREEVLASGGHTIGSHAASGHDFQASLETHDRTGCPNTQATDEAIADDQHTRRERKS